jgi:hypothetical protein
MHGVAPKTAAAVLNECDSAGRTGIFLLGEHAADRARERNISKDDIRNALMHSSSATLQENGRWYVSGGADLDGDPINFALSFERGLLIVTLF